MLTKFQAWGGVLQVFPQWGQTCCHPCLAEEQREAQGRAARNGESWDLTQAAGQASKALKLLCMAGSAFSPETSGTDPPGRVERIPRPGSPVPRLVLGSRSLPGSGPYPQVADHPRPGGPGLWLTTQSQTGSSRSKAGHIPCRAWGSDFYFSPFRTLGGPVGLD